MKTDPKLNSLFNNAEYKTRTSVGPCWNWLALAFQRTEWKLLPPSILTYPKRTTESLLDLFVLVLHLISCCLLQKSDLGSVSCVTCVHSSGQLRRQYQPKPVGSFTSPLSWELELVLYVPKAVLNHLLGSYHSLPSSQLSSSVVLWIEQGIWNWKARVGFWLSCKRREAVWCPQFHRTQHPRYSPPGCLAPRNSAKYLLAEWKILIYF